MPAPLVVAALYHFAALPDPAERKPALLSRMWQAGVTGTLILAGEGVNGTIAGPRAGIDSVLDHLRAWPGFHDLTAKESLADLPPFRRSKVKVKAEIVTLGQPEADPARGVGRYVAPRDWNALIRSPDVAVIDTRNDYEVSIGTFRGAVDPGLARFRDFPAWWAAHAQDFAGRRVAMFCTGGIRCEKSTAFLRAQGVEEVYHLQGGILKYLEDVPAEDSLWQGECFVFDERVAVTHGLAQGTARMCPACGRPHYGPACPSCNVTDTKDHLT